jgi:hypothetical protein
MSGWIDELRGLTVAAVASDLGLKLQRGTMPCPGCGAERRGSSDRRGPVGVRRDGLGWRCHRCQAGGDALDLVAVSLHGDRARELAPDDLREVRGWCADHGWCSAGGDAPVVPRPPRPRPPPPAPPGYPPQDEVKALWAACELPSSDAEAVAWFASRGLDVGAVEDRCHVRVLPKGIVAPRWAASWASRGYRLLLPLYDEHGVFRSLRARAIVLGAKPKALAPTGHEVCGLALACPFARTILRTATMPDWWPEGLPLDVIVTEGEPDFMTWRSLFSDADETAPAVLGVVAGSWSDALGKRIPPGVRVVIRTHADAAGDIYAARIASALPDGVEILRPVAPEETPHGQAA